MTPRTTCVSTGQAYGLNCSMVPTSRNRSNGSGNTQKAGRRAGQKARRALCRRPTDPASRAAVVLQERWDPTFSEHSYAVSDRDARPIRRWPKRNAMLPKATTSSLISTSKSFSTELTTIALWPGLPRGYPTSGVLKPSFGHFSMPGVMEDGLVLPVDEGTPQGGLFSPLFKQHHARRSRQASNWPAGVTVFCRYADDCKTSTFVASAPENWVMASVSRFPDPKAAAERSTRAKSEVARPEGAQVSRVQHLRMTGASGASRQKPPRQIQGANPGDDGRPDTGAPAYRRSSRN